MLDKLNSGKIIIFWKKGESYFSGQDHNNATTNNIKIVDFIELCMNSNVIRKIKWSCSGNATMSNILRRSTCKIFIAYKIDWQLLNYFCKYNLFQCLN